MNNELRTKNYRLNTSDERQATCDEFALVWSFFADFCAFCASLWLIMHLFSWLLKKAVSMALWTKATLCVKSSLLEQSLPRTQSQPKTCLPHEIAQRYLFGVSSVPKNPFNQRNLRLNISSCSSCASWLKNPFNRRNPRLINDLRLFMALYNCKETFTDVRKTLQINLFMQNKANFRKVKLNVNKVITMAYDQLDTWSIRKTKPIQSQLKPIKANFNPKQTQNKPNACPPSVWRDGGKKCCRLFIVALPAKNSFIPSENFSYHCSVTRLLSSTESS